MLHPFNSSIVANAGIPFNVLSTSIKVQMSTLLVIIATEPYSTCTPARRPALGFVHDIVKQPRRQAVTAQEVAKKWYHFTFGV